MFPNQFQPSLMWYLPQKNLDSLGKGSFLGVWSSGIRRGHNFVYKQPERSEAHFEGTRRLEDSKGEQTH